ncbi:hypothetical protein SAY87_000790 [Trapa incisa]|uniref:Uncharacterized protein n=2 Tax=Trapa TaxID=22665 RepID=A0AAN7MZL8_TRANT|nr:hypothetical protein SAY87_000790 [Trapa incisa]KAK4801248.1 hypothetical protein SAY86_021735 [Trapa natans]
MEVGGKGSTPSPSPWRSPSPDPSYYYNTRTAPTSSRERLVAIGLALVAVFSPLFIDRRSAWDHEDEASGTMIVSLTVMLPLLLLGLMTAIATSLYLDHGVTRFDPNWIHRVGGSSGGIIVILMVLALVLRCKAGVSCWEA